MALALQIPRLSDLERARLHPAPSFSRKPLLSCVCKASDFLSDGYLHWCAMLKETPRWHRKQWEWCYIAQVLSERGCLVPGKRGLGFAVGHEPLPATFAALGTEIVATDAPPEVAAAGNWDSSGVWAGQSAAVNDRGICDDAAFGACVRFATVDMRQIPKAYEDGFDFVWSSCAFEHLGSVDAGLRFMVEQARCLKYGGVSVHTTELRLFADAPSVDLGDSILFCKDDLERLGEMLAEQGVRLVPFNWELGRDPADCFVDPELNEQLHLRRLMSGYVTTSVGVIAVRTRP
jgi:SAM-dependent methyltransferase